MLWGKCLFLFKASQMKRIYLKLSNELQCMPKYLSESSEYVYHATNCGPTDSNTTI